MKKITITQVALETQDYLPDLTRIQKILEGKDYEATLPECLELWRLYSDSMCAGFMTLPENDEDVYFCIRGYFE